MFTQHNWHKYMFYMCCSSCFQFLTIIPSPSWEIWHWYAIFREVLRVMVYIATFAIWSTGFQCCCIISAALITWPGFEERNHIDLVDQWWLPSIAMALDWGRQWGVSIYFPVFWVQIGTVENPVTVRENMVKQTSSISRCCISLLNISWWLIQNEWSRFYSSWHMLKGNFDQPKCLDDAPLIGAVLSCIIIILWSIRVLMHR